MKGNNTRTLQRFLWGRGSSKSKLPMSHHYHMWNQYYSCLCLSILTRYCCDRRVNKVSLSTPTHKILLSSIPILSCAWLTLKKGLEVAHGASLFSASSEVPWADGSLPSVLRTQVRHQVQQSSLSDLWAGEEGDRGTSRLKGCFSGAVGDAYCRKPFFISMISCHSWEQCAELIRLIERPGILIEPLSPSC